MGLSIEVGLLAFRVSTEPEGAEWLREVFGRVNLLLAQHNLPAHAEPERLPPLHSRARERGFSYSFLHYLRRVAAHAAEDPDWVATPLPDGEDPARDAVLAERYYLLDSHLLCHSDSEGFYLPQDFKKVLFGEDEKIPGGMVGSSPALLRELVRMAPALGIRLEESQLTDVEVARLTDLIAGNAGIFRELIVWIALFEAARLSIEHGAAICFA